MKITKFLFPIAIFALIILLLISPSVYSTVALDGALVWATILVPTLFPFMFFSRLFTSFDVTKNLSKPFSCATKKLYNCPSDCANIFLLSMLCGYPIGAKLIQEAYLEGNISKGQAQRCMSFTSTCGPMFIIGSVGVGMLKSSSAGICIYFCHIIGSLINGIIYRKKYLNLDTIYSEKKYTSTEKTSMSDIVFSSISSILLVGAYVIIFFIIAQVFINLNIFTPIATLLSKIGVSEDITNGMLCGLLEITKGASTLSNSLLHIKYLIPLLTFVVSFGGFSTFMQSHAFLEKIGVKKSTLFIQKTTQAIICSALSLVVCLIFF